MLSEKLERTEMSIAQKNRRAQSQLQARKDEDMLMRDIKAQMSEHRTARNMASFYEQQEEKVIKTARRIANSSVRRSPRVRRGVETMAARHNRQHEALKRVAAAENERMTRILRKIEDHDRKTEALSREQERVRRRQQDYRAQKSIEMGVQVSGRSGALAMQRKGDVYRQQNKTPRRAFATSAGSSRRRVGTISAAARRSLENKISLMPPRSNQGNNNDSSNSNSNHGGGVEVGHAQQMRMEEVQAYKERMADQHVLYGGLSAEVPATAPAPYQAGSVHAEIDPPPSTAPLALQRQKPPAMHQSQEPYGNAAWYYVDPQALHRGRSQMSR